MKIILILIGTSLVVALVFLVLFIRAVRSGQYDDIESPARRMLFDSNTRKSKESGNMT
ncbi:cbb3-type cytochrome oxidase assembly protein CcoS [Marinigracilibium pacificum]|uniref:Cbb3-type cytochrome oxidase assembly protein CcoS n=1 Tax=Marinigracilibium pacificum TaxID=2729599 RepID=A0A848J3B4_9BACT|nr:cbb3-type cytochrome oxidase assembly protein CcoS [Marinigracilibium pacificum]NMM50236.1 cbb3-type cytochrome oxidase assembly protein CcoS [Marinigracilibium pacificum]